jgi:SulP family sulfate permease
LRQAGLLTPASGLALYRTDAEALIALQHLPPSPLPEDQGLAC